MTHVADHPVRAASPFCLLALIATVGCAAPLPSEISRDRAVALAVMQVTFEPSSIDADRATSGGVPVWRVTLRGRLPGQPPDLFETTIVEIDRRSGVIIGIARN